MREAGIDVDRAIADGQLELHPWDELYLAGGTFNKNEMAGRLQKLLTERIAQGFPMGRLVAHMEWALEERPGVQDLAQYEAQVDRMLSNFDDVVVCVYDLSKFPATTIVDVMRSHPSVVVAGSLHANPFYAVTPS